LNRDGSFADSVGFCLIRPNKALDLQRFWPLAMAAVGWLGPMPARTRPVDFQKEWAHVSVGSQKERRQMLEKPDVYYGTLALMVLKTLETLGPQHGYGIARRIEQISGDQLALNQGTLYPSLLRLEQMGWVKATWALSENNRRARFYAITPRGRQQLQAETDHWNRAQGIVARFLNASPSEV
jgi:PadR family transcriptional regulator PadR